MKKLLVGAISAFISFGSIASTIGVSNHPFVMSKHIVTTEFNNYLSSGSGAGITAKYTRRYNEKLSIDAGFGFTNGERESEMIIGADLSLIPDYGRQPRGSIKSFMSTSKIDGERINSLGMAPTLSKGFVFWGKEAYPFIALPLKVSLNTAEGTYETSTAIAIGMTGRIPVGDFKDLVGNIETNFSLRNSYAALVMGVSLPIQ
jgi:hypothetical protein